MTKFRKFLSDESGNAAIEYGLIAGIVAVGLIAGFSDLKDKLKNSFTAIGTTISNNVK